MFSLALEALFERPTIGAMKFAGMPTRSVIVHIDQSGSVFLQLHDAKLHRDTFAIHGEYLEEKLRGVASGEFLADFSFELSHGFKALKIWMSLKEQGVEKFGRLIDQNIAQGAYLTQLIEAEQKLELMAPRSINIVCFRHRGTDPKEAAVKAMNTEIMLRIQEAGMAVATDTTVHGRDCLRIAINNHRTTRADLELFIAEVLRLGAELERWPSVS